MPNLHFEDFAPGDIRVLGPVTVTKDEMVAFAREFDPQPFHVDEVAAKDTFVGTLIASGWHTAAINMRLIAEAILVHSTSMGAPGIEELRWLLPVRPGDTLRSRVTIKDTRPSGSRPTIGLVQFKSEVLNQRDEVVLSQLNWVMFGRREAGPPVEGRAKDPVPRSEAHAPDTAITRVTPNAYLDDLVAGETAPLGSHTFTAEEIIRFGKAYDPQRFHVDPVAAKDSLFGGLCASGWHTAAIWMKLMAAYREGIRVDALSRGERPARLGSSPGFKNMRWFKPVFAGDTLTYRTRLTSRRASASHSGWGIAFHHNVATNQHGEDVFAFDGTVFWERRPA
jgi:acyl dehydratase